MFNFQKTLYLILSFVCFATANAQTAAMPATVDISAIGAATYSIPVDVVPGTNGMQPSLTITYNSLSGCSPMGFHWGLQGISSITRCPQTEYFDGDIRQLGLNTDDRFSLDGKRMVLLRGTRYHSPDALYAFEIDDLSRIQRVTDPDDSFYFVDTLADGQIIEFGATQDARQYVDGKVLSWMINKITDANGNYINYNYGQNDGEIFIERIDYTFNPSASLTTAYASISFDYRTALKQNELFVASGRIKQSRLLESITVSYIGNQVRKYVFTYNEEWHAARLTKISLLDANDNEISYTNIKWDDIPEMTTNDGLSFLPNGFTLVVGNFNDDRLYDFMAIRGREVRLYTKKQDGTYGIVSNGNVTWSFGEPDHRSFYAIDIDDDGIDELVYSNTNGQLITAEVCASPNSLSVTSSSLFGGNLTRFGSIWGDYDGDAKPEVIIPVANVNYTFCYGFENSQSNIVYDIDTGFSAVASGDFNGDGKSELITIKGYEYRIWSYKVNTGRWACISSGTFPGKCVTCLSGDINGDGITDLVMLFKMSRTTWKWISAIKKGTTADWVYTAIPEIRSDIVADSVICGGTTIVTEYAKYPTLLCDFNSDGKADIMQPDENDYVHLLLSEGCLSGQYNYETAGFSHYSNQPFFAFELGRIKHYFTIGDIDGNGTPDIVLNSVGSGGVHPSAIYFYKGSMAGNYVSRITDVMDKTVRFEYSTLSIMQERYSGQNMRWMPLPVVNKTLCSNGIGGYDTTYYFYGRTQYDEGKHQFLGFGRFGKRNNGQFIEYRLSKPMRDGNTGFFGTLLMDSILTYSSPSNPYSKPVFYSGTAIWYTSADTLTSLVSNTSAILTRSSAAGTVLYLPYISSTDHTDYLTNRVTRSTTVFNSLNWRPSSLSKIYTYKNGQNSITQSETSSYQYANTVLANGATIPQVSLMTTNHYYGQNEPPYRQNTIVRNYLQGRVSSETVSDNGGYSCTTTYKYTPAGNLLKVTKTPAGEMPRYNKYTYDATYRFAETETDQSLTSVGNLYDGTTGNIVESTDINGLVTSFEYDSWGRCTKTLFPDGTSRQTTFIRGTGGFLRVVLYSETVESGQPPTRSYYDALGRERHRYVSGVGYSDIVYNNKGQISRRTAIPYQSVQQSEDSKYWQTFSYDIYGRIVKDSSFYNTIVSAYHCTQYNQQSYLFSESVENNTGSVKTTYYDAAGRIVKVSDNGGTINYKYGFTQRSQGICDSMAIISGDNVTSIISDIRGNRLLLRDPDAGTVTSSYNGWNELTSQTDANGNTISMAYDNQGRVISKAYTSTDNVSDSYTYTYNNSYTSSSRGKGKLASVVHNGLPYKNFDYDQYGRLSSKSKIIGSNTYTHQFTYNSVGKLQTKTYPDGFGIRYSYDNDGNLQQIENATTNEIIYGVGLRNAANQPTLCWFGNNTGVKYTYNSYGLPIQIKYGYTVLDDPVLPPTPDRNDSTRTIPDASIYTVDDHYSVLDYTYNQNGYITQKNDSKACQYENYVYDALGRLTQYSVNNSISYYLNYDGSGNITRNTKVSPYYYDYDASQPHAVSGIEANQGAISSAQCDVTYNSRNRPASISQDGWQLQLAYDDGLQRESAVLSHNSAHIETIHYISDDCERDTKFLGSRYLDYIHAGGRIVAIHVKNGTTDSIYYVQTDLLGSWEKIVDNNRNVVQSSHFDPWGNRMCATDWTAGQDGTSFSFRRGFTGHEHYDRFCIINMNARLYDPVIGRFFSPDPQVQNPFSTQGLNRYTYCGNNPVMYMDEDGEFAWIIPVISGLVNLGVNIVNALVSIK